MHRLEVAGVEDVALILPHLRAADVAEVEASFPGGDAETAILFGIALSPVAITWWAGDTPVMIGGVAPHPEDPTTGVPWGLGTDAVRPNREFFIPAAAKVIKTMLRHFERLENHVDARNTAAVGWLSKAGFTIHPAEPYGPRGIPFHRFTMERKHVCTSSRRRRNGGRFHRRKRRR